MSLFPARNRIISAATDLVQRDGSAFAASKDFQDMYVVDMARAPGIGAGRSDNPIMQLGGQRLQASNLAPALLFQLWCKKARVLFAACAPTHPDPAPDIHIHICRSRFENPCVHVGGNFPSNIQVCLGASCDCWM
ncbi:hypothetical protein NKI56_35430 [Mesorhizobium sp. M0622]|uniref:hypothetical protein n=1 Tax=unclassified Mesorhizobium TaxID=325217 RepID=UPI003339922E